MPFILGVTGGIGSGKSAATDCFTALGITVIDADEISREVVQKDSPALAAIAEHFGNDALLPSGELNRAFLRECIFADTEEKNWLESLLHPLIRERIQEQLALIDSPYGVLSSPLLFETNQNALVNRTLVIDTTEELQQQRASTRDDVDSEQIAAIMQNQLPREERNKKADDIICNTESLDDLREAINTYHKNLLASLNT